MSRPAHSRADEDFVAFGLEEARPAAFTPLAEEQPPQAWEPLLVAGEEEPLVPPPQARPSARHQPAAPDVIPGVAADTGLPDIPPVLAPPPAAGGPVASSNALASTPAAVPVDDGFTALSGAGDATPVLDPQGPDGTPVPDAGPDLAGKDPLAAEPEAGADPAAENLADSGGAEEGGESDGYGFVSAAAGAGEGEAGRAAQARLLSEQLADGLDRMAVELAEQLSATVGRILEPVVSRTVRERMTARFLEAASQALAMRPETPCRLEAPRDLVPLLRDEMARKGFNVAVTEGAGDGLTLRLDTEVLAARFTGLPDMAGEFDDE